MLYITESSYLCIVFSEHDSFYCSIIHSNLHLEGEYKSKNYTTLGFRFIAQTSSHSSIGAVQGPSGYMDGACAFSIPVTT